MQCWIEKYKVKDGTEMHRVCWLEDGKRYSKTTGSLAANARSFQNRIEDRLRRLKNGTGKGTVSIATCINDYIEHRWRPNNNPNKNTMRIIESSLKKLKDRFEGQNMDDLDGPAMQRAKSDLLNNHVSNGANFKLRDWKAFFKWAHENGYVYQNPMLHVTQYRPVVVAHFLNRAEMALLYQAAERRFRRFIHVLVETGLRRGELINLKKEDIDVGRRLARIVKTKKKSHELGVRFVPLSESVMRVLPGVIEKWGEWAVGSAWSRMIKKLPVSFGRTRPHDMRHTFAKNFLQSGGTMPELMKILGHESVQTTKIYAHFETNHLREVMANVRFRRERSLVLNGESMGNGGQNNDKLQRTLHIA